MGRPQDGHSWIRRMIRMRAASRRSTILRSVRRRALPSPQAAVERHSIRSGGRALRPQEGAGTPLVASRPCPRLVRRKARGSLKKWPSPLRPVLS
jgi:hypothetical protein